MDTATATGIMSVIQKTRVVHPADYTGPAGPWIWLADLHTLGDSIPTVLDRAEGDDGHWNEAIDHLNGLIGCALAVPAPEEDFLGEPFDLIEECRVRAKRYTDHMVLDPGVITERLQFSLQYVGHQMRAHMNAPDVIGDGLDRNLIAAQTAAEWAADVAVLAAMLHIAMSSISPSKETE